MIFVTGASVKTSRKNQLTAHAPLNPPHPLLTTLLDASLVLAEDWEGLSSSLREEIVKCTELDALLPRLVQHGLLTDYQAARISGGKTFGLVLGNHRILERLGAGGMGTVFKAEHIRMRRHVAIKVLSLTSEQSPKLLLRFFSEMRAIAKLQHPHIAHAYDSGELASSDPEAPVLHYLVMEYVPGCDLESLVSREGPLSPSQVCEIGYQVASGLAEAHKQNLVHRDIKPSNIMWTPDGQAKLLDFGLARHFRNRLTDQGVLLGTMDYLAPEQAQDASAVDIRADIYGLGGTLFWCLTGRAPFPSLATVREDIQARLNQEPPSVRRLRPDVPPDLDAVLMRMMARHPDDRYLNPQAVMRALAGNQLSVGSGRRSASGTGLTATGSELPNSSEHGQPHRVLIVDDEAANRTLCALALETEGLHCGQAGNGLEAFQAFRDNAFDLVLLDIDMPEMNGTETLRCLRENPPSPNLKIIMVSGRVCNEEMAKMLAAGADDYLPKPLSLPQLAARIKAALKLKEVQDRADILNRHLLKVNAELERNLSSRDSDLIHARNALVLALAKVVEHRQGAGGGHSMRMQHYSRCLAEEAASRPNFAGQITEEFVQMLECCAPLHDLGKVGLPDDVLLHPGKWSQEEKLIQQTHTTVGGEILAGMAGQRGFGQVFLRMAIDIVRHHHERWDGSGYPDRLSGNAIPLAARLVALADMYDALRSRRSYRPALSHATAAQLILESAGQFDPALLPVFQNVSERMEQIFRESR